PVSGWGNVYYSSPVGALTGSNDHFWALGSVNNQTIYRHDCSNEEHNLYGNEWNAVQTPSKWYSYAPFLLVQYCGDGNPAEVVLSPKEKFGKIVSFPSGNGLGLQS